MAEKRRWKNSVRSYLCGDEHKSVLSEEDSASHAETSPTPLNSVLAEKDSGSVMSFEGIIPELNSVLEDEESGSVKSSEATVTQPIEDEYYYLLQVQKLHHLASKDMMREEQAAIIIQSAFRGFLARRKSEAIKWKGGENESPSRESHGTSMEVQTGNSVEDFSALEERTAVQRRAQQKVRTLVIKEDWDDSTVSSNITKMRIQNRLEASTRRERALAYAFSQQLRLCSKKREAKLNDKEPNMGWSWLERWMATRFPETAPVESRTSKPVELIYRNQRFKTGKTFFEIAGEEKESCGSNEVSVSFDGISVANWKDGSKPTRNRKTITIRNVSKRKTVPSNHCPKDYTNTKVKKEGTFKEDTRDKRHQAEKSAVDNHE
ncbi:protein IQ-DOMAIN 1 isoform X2 [Morus notabilis]|nr:protein IQ-DOMAIN 1 isoform X2 [Morus notabilis]